MLENEVAVAVAVAEAEASACVILRCFVAIILFYNIATLLLLLLGAAGGIFNFHNWLLFFYLLHVSMHMYVWRYQYTTSSTEYN